MGSIEKNTENIETNRTNISANAANIEANRKNINDLGYGVAGATALTAALSSLPLLLMTHLSPAVLEQVVTAVALRWVLVVQQD